MGIFFVFLICVGLIMLNVFLYCKLDNTSYDLWSAIPACLIVILIVVSIITVGCSVHYGFSCANLEAKALQIQQTREMYVSQLETYDYDRPNRLTESTVYLELRKDVIKFNANVAAAKAHEGHWWCEGILWERWYSGVELIDLK